MGICFSREFGELVQREMTFGGFEKDRNALKYRCPAENYGFENHYIRGIKKMNARCGLALCVMLSMALGRIREKQKNLMHSLVKSA